MTRRSELLRRAVNALRWRSRALGDRLVIAVRHLLDLSLPLGVPVQRLGRRMILFPFRREANQVPPALDIGGRKIDVVEDLIGFTGLSRARVETEIRTRANTSFRAEWHTTPPAWRQDHWFYLSSKGYLFGNASHFAGRSFADRIVVPYLPDDGRVLDFGGGTGNLTLTLAALGYSVHYAELNALQRDFVRYRVARNGFDQCVKIVDWWSDRWPDEVDAVVAVDVLEHVEDGRDVLARLISLLVPAGVLIEASPFVRNVSNPMHSEDFGLVEQLTSAKFRVIASEGPDLRIWQRAARESPD